MKSKICDSVCKRKYSFVLKGAGTSTEIGNKKYKILLDRVDVITAYQVYNQYNPKQNKERCVIDLAPIDLVDIFKRNCKFTPSIVLEDISFSPFYIGKITCACITDKEELCLIVDCNGFKSKSRFNDEMPVGELKNVRIQIDSSSEQINPTKTTGIFKFSLDTSDWDSTLPLITDSSSFTGTPSTSVDGNTTNVSIDFSYKTISGNDGLSFSNVAYADSYSLNIIQFGGIPLSRGGYQFSNINLGVGFNGKITATDAPKILPGTSLAYCFYQATGFNNDISTWNTSYVTDMSNMFNETISFNQNIGNWNTGNVSDMSSMFVGSEFNGDISLWNTAKVTDMSSMFNGSQFNSDISLWNVSNVKDMSRMLNGTNFNQDISNWNTTNVTDMSCMFNGDNGFTDFNQNISNWKTGNVTDMSGMFGQTSFNQDIGNWNTGNVTDMSIMFNLATSFNQDLSGWCVTLIKSEPLDFSTGSKLTQENKPIWGTCPSNN
jgi:surface protein